mgnify:CR=1 FL=1
MSETTAAVTEQDTTDDYTRYATSQEMVNRINPTGVIEADDGSKITVGVGRGGAVTVVETDADGNNFLLYSGDGDDNESWKTQKAYGDAAKMFSDMQEIYTSTEEVAVDESQNVQGGGGNLRTLQHSSTTTNTGTTIGGYGGNLQQTDACLLYTSPSPRDRQKSRMPSSA